jgi:hypothetical protein
LKNKTDAHPQGVDIHCGFMDILSIEENLSAVHFLEAVDGPDECALA